MQAPENVPANGLYYHYKHDPNGEVNNYAYRVVGVGKHTEDEETFFVIYRPLYEATVFKLGKLFDVRPLAEFMERVLQVDRSIPRFKKITDPQTILALYAIEDKMYPGSVLHESDPGSPACF